MVMVLSAEGLRLRTEGCQDNGRARGESLNVFMDASFVN